MAQAIVIVTIHAGDHSRAIFGPFASGDEASKWGFRNFPNNTSACGHSVTWCWQELHSPNANIREKLEMEIN